jgi:hypothetical protein
MKNQLRDAISNQVHSHERCTAIGARAIAASLALCAPALALSAASSNHDNGEERVARPIARAEDVKTLPALVAKPAAVAVAAKPVASASDHSRLIWSAPSDGVLRARGSTFKAEFSAAGATYVPLFGAHAPKNHPVSFHLDSLACGGRALEVERTAPAFRAGDSVIFERGAAREVYDVAAGSIEQKFVFASTPSGVELGGDLELVVGVDTDLSRGASDSGLELENELGAVHYGRAQIVDAAGRQAPATTEWSGDAIHIVAPGSFLRDATFPVTIDPLISTFTVDNSSDDDFAPDVAFDATTGNWITVYEEAISASDHDVLAVISETNGLAIPFGLYYIDNTAENWTKPRVANNRSGEQFLIVAEVGTVGSRSIRGRTLHADGVGMGGKFTISAQDIGDVTHPDVGGDPGTVGASYYCVVWERIWSAADHDVHAVLVSPVNAVSPILYVDNTSATLDTNPAISKSDGLPPFASQEWTIAWERLAAPGDHDILGAQVHWDGTLTHTTFPMMTTPADETAPRVSSLLDGGAAPRPYMVVCQMLYGPGDHDIQGGAFTGTVASSVVNLSEIDAYFQWSADQVQPAIETDGHQFVVGYSEQWPAGSSNYETILSTFNSAGGVIGLTEQRTLLTSSSATDDALSIVAMHSGGASGQTCLAAWCTSAIAQTRDINGALYQVVVGGPKTGFCFGTAQACPCNNAGLPASGCANSQNPQGGHLDALGDAVVASDSLVLHADGMPSPSTCLYFQGTGTNPHVVGDGWMCAGSGLVRLGVKSNVNGASTFGDGNDPHLSLKGNVPAAGGTRYYQVWYRDNHSYCNAETFNFTNGVSVTWVP